MDGKGRRRKVSRKQTSESTAHRNALVAHDFVFFPRLLFLLLSVAPSLSPSERSRNGALPDARRVLFSRKDLPQVLRIHCLPYLFAQPGLSGNSFCGSPSLLLPTPTLFFSPTC